MPRPSRAINYHKTKSYHSAADHSIRVKLEQAQDEAECDELIRKGRLEIQAAWTDAERDARAGKRRSDESVKIKEVCDKWTIYQCRIIT